MIAAYPRLNRVCAQVTAIDSVVITITLYDKSLDGVNSSCTSINRTVCSPAEDATWWYERVLPKMTSGTRADREGGASALYG